MPDAGPLNRALLISAFALPLLCGAAAAQPVGADPAPAQPGQAAGDMRALLWSVQAQVAGRLLTAAVDCEKITSEEGRKVREAFDGEVDAKAGKFGADYVKELRDMFKAGADHARTTLSQNKAAVCGSLRESAIAGLRGTADGRAQFLSPMPPTPR